MPETVTAAAVAVAEGALVMVDESAPSVDAPETAAAVAKRNRTDMVGGEGVTYFRRIEPTTAAKSSARRRCRPCPPCPPTRRPPLQTGAQLRVDERSNSPRQRW